MVCDPKEMVLWEDSSTFYGIKSQAIYNEFVSN